jgi:glycosyltransferase involved in cell wall biosynthesis
MDTSDAPPDRPAAVRLHEADARRCLLVTNAYPSDGALYRNAFLHPRVRAYRAAGLVVEVFYLHPPVRSPYTYEYDGVHVTVGDSRALEQLVAGTDLDCALVHFASPGMLAPLDRYRSDVPVVVWVHGFEAEAWHRRWFNGLTSAADARALLRRKADYHDSQLPFMRWLLAERPGTHVVNVSDWFRRHVVEPDVGAAVGHGHVIPNVVDTDLFRYRPKDAGQRLRLLSVRPYTGYKYANDLTVQALAELARRPYFPRLHVTVRGSGPEFEATVAPLRTLPNVDVREGFLRHEEIADLHRDHGVLLTPTRFDSQGVSMCEGMSSGLVPLSTEVAAIPEFVTHRESGLLSPPEDPAGLADHVEQLVYDPELFARLSEGAAARVRAQCGPDATVAREVALIEELL